jgi:cytochrome b561
MEPMAAPARRYDGAAILLHWSSVALVAALVGTGLVMTRLTAGSADQFALYQLHKALGVTLLLTTLLRCAWRVIRPPPPLPSVLSTTARAAARLGHVLLYLCLAAVPLAGWALVSASPLAIPTSLFGLATWPHLPVLSDLDPASRGRLAPVLARAHAMLAYALVGLVALHSAAALWHGRPVLARMTPGEPARGSRT